MDRSTVLSRVQERLGGISPAVLPEGVKPIGSSAYLVRLAARLGVSPNTLAARLSPETIRRTKYPVLEQRDLETGLTTFRHPIVIDEGPKTKP